MTLPPLPPRPADWVEGVKPTPEQILDWLESLDREGRLQVIARLCWVGDLESECWQSNHNLEVEKFRRMCNQAQKDLAYYGGSDDPMSLGRAIGAEEILRA